MKGLPWYEARAKMAKKRINSLLDLMESPYFDMVQEVMFNRKTACYTHEEALKVLESLKPVKQLGWSFKCFQKSCGYDWNGWEVYCVCGPNNIQFSYRTTLDLHELLHYYIKDLEKTIDVINAYKKIGNEKAESLASLTKNQIIVECYKNIK